MLYHLIRLLAVLSLERFYNKIVVANRERVAENRPTIFVANHPNTMIDALVVGYASHKRVRIVAKSGLFQNKFASWFLTKVGLIPIHRRQDDPSQMDQNVAIFGRLYEHLESGGSVLLFPEGVSEPGRKLQRIKTGAARIALGAEEKNDFDLGVQIVPVGLNYSDIQKFRSDVYCRFGKPVLPGDYRQQYQDDPVQVVRDLTETIRSGLEKVVALVGEDSLENLVSSLQTIYKQELMTDLGLDERSQTDDFFVTKALIDAARWFTKHDPDRMEKLSTEM
ncbi:MAG: lysophospholipid acyltransferase family protein, partial [Fidelibacterota bacterium]